MIGEPGQNDEADAAADDAEDDGVAAEIIAFDNIDVATPQESICDHVLDSNEIGAGFLPGGENSLDNIYIGMTLGVYDPGVELARDDLADAGFEFEIGAPDRIRIIPEFVGYVEVAGINTALQTITITNQSKAQLDRTIPTPQGTFSDTGFDSGDIIFDPNSIVDRLSQEARAGRQQIMVTDSSQFMVGQSIQIQTTATQNNENGVGGEVAVIEQKGDNNVLFLAEPLAESHPENTIVRDARARAYAVRGVSPLNDNWLAGDEDEHLLSTRITRGDAVLVFREEGGAESRFNGLSVGDMVLIDTDGNKDTLSDQAWGKVRVIQTVRGNATGGENIGDPLEENGLVIQRLELEEVTLASGANSADFDPTVAWVLAMGDTLLFDAADIADSSANAPLDVRKNQGTIDANGINGVGNEAAGSFIWGQ